MNKLLPSTNVTWVTFTKKVEVGTKTEQMKGRKCRKYKCTEKMSKKRSFTREEMSKIKECFFPNF